MRENHTPFNVGGIEKIVDSFNIVYLANYYIVIFLWLKI